MTSARNRELLALVPASLLLTAGFAAVFIERNDVVNNVSLTYGAIFLGLCLAAHMVLRFTLPYADPYLFPLFAVLACFGLVMIYRIDEKLAREQAQWFVIGLGLFAATIVLLRDYRVLERYRYVIALAGIGLLVLPRLPVIGAPVNGAYLGVRERDAQEEVRADAQPEEHRAIGEREVRELVGLLDEHRGEAGRHQQRRGHEPQQLAVAGAHLTCPRSILRTRSVASDCERRR